MNTVATPTAEQRVQSGNGAALARLRSLSGEPLFIADWDRALFIHFEVDPVALQRETPFALDLWAGRAFVSLVAFTLGRLRPRRGGRATGWITAPVSTHEFLNVRTYVRHAGEPGIFFLAEWVPNRISLALGPKFFGLPYRLGKFQYRHDADAQVGSVSDARTGAELKYSARALPQCAAAEAADALDDFLLERYTAYTCLRDTRRFFRIWHPPWQHVRTQAELERTDLLASTWRWFADAQLCGAHSSPGARDVWMGWPHVLPRHARHHGSSALFDLAEV